MQIIFDPENRQDLALLDKLLLPKGIDNQLSLDFGPVAEPAVAEPAVAEPAPTPAPTPTPTAIKTKTKKSVPVDAPPPEDATTAEPASLTLDDVRAALNAFVVANGIPAGTALVKAFNGSRVSDLPADSYAAFMQACQQGSQT